MRVELLAIGVTVAKEEFGVRVEVGNRESPHLIRRAAFNSLLLVAATP